MTVQSDEFQVWLAHHDDFLAELRAEAPPALRPLEPVPASLDGVEAWLLKRFPTIDAARAPEAARTINRFAVHLGETFRLALDLRWHLDTVPDSVFFNLPVLRGPAVAAICPLTLTTAATSRRRGDYWSTILANRLANRSAD